MTLTDAEKTLIIAALHAVAPSGGGSMQYHLARKLQEEWKVPEPLDEYIIHLQTTIHREVNANLT